MKHYIITMLLALTATIGFAQQPIKIPTRPTKTAPAAKPRPSAKPKPTRRTSSAGRNRPNSIRSTEVVSTSSVQELPSVTSGLTIDLGLSVKWASHNVGANSPEEYGNYYGWADPTGKTSIDINDYPSANPPSNISGTSYDIARQNWGGNWRLPTMDEFKELANNCTCRVITLNGVSGMKFTSDKNGNSIFFPFAGHRWDSNVSEQGSRGNYWSGTLDNTDSRVVCDLEIKSSGIVSWDLGVRCCGFSVRPVTP